MGLKKSYIDPDLTPSNVKEGVDIFGVTGSLKQETLESLGGTRFRTGSGNHDATGKISVTGLPFTPSTVKIHYSNGGSVVGVAVLTNPKRSAWNGYSISGVRGHMTSGNGINADTLRFYNSANESGAGINGNSFEFTYGNATTYSEWTAYE